MYDPKERSEIQDKELPPTGLELIIAERERQITQEGWTAEHDDSHLDYDLSTAGGCYALHCLLIKHPNYQMFFDKILSYFWPWEHTWWKPTTPNDPIRQLAKAGALIAAEIDRLQRQKNG